MTESARRLTLMQINDTPRHLPPHRGRTRTGQGVRHKDAVETPRRPMQHAQPVCGALHGSVVAV